MEQTNKSDKQMSEGQDEVDRSYQRRTVRQFYHESSPGFSGIEILESPARDDSAYHTFPHTSSSHSFSKSSSYASSDRFPSEESLRSSSPMSLPSSSKKVHSTLIRIQLGDDKKVSHEWYSEFTNQSHHNQAFNSPLVNRAAKSSSHFEYDTHIAQMRGNFVFLFFLV